MKLPQKYQLKEKLKSCDLSCQPFLEFACLLMIYGLMEICLKSSIPMARRTGDFQFWFPYLRTHFSISALCSTVQFTQVDPIIARKLSLLLIFVLFQLYPQLCTSKDLVKLVISGDMAHFTRKQTHASGTQGTLESFIEVKQLFQPIQVSL